MSELLYDIDELAAELKTTVKAIRQQLYRQNYKAIPPPVKLGKRVVWMKDRVKVWLNERADNSSPTIPAPSQSASIPTTPATEPHSEKSRRGRPRKPL